MKFTIEFGGDPQDVTVTFSGVADLPGFSALQRTVHVGSSLPCRDDDPR
jgi:hypothetical protein